MRNVTATYGCVTPFSKFIGQKVTKCILLSFSVLTLTGCVTSSSTKAPAPMPPELSFYNKNFSAAMQNQFTVQQIIPASGVSDDVPPAVVTSPLIEEMTQRLSLNKETTEKECRLKDRFDRKAILAYEWKRSRLALDVDGLNVGLTGVSEFEAVKLEYRLRLQPEKPRRENCRYKSRWQGLLGSGYNELFLRQDDTVWQELRNVRKKATEAVGRMF